MPAVTLTRGSSTSSRSTRRAFNGTYIGADDHVAPSDWSMFIDYTPS